MLVLDQSISFMKALVEAGAAIVLVSSELPEVLHLSNRVYITTAAWWRSLSLGNDITEQNVLARFFQDSSREPLGWSARPCDRAALVERLSARLSVVELIPFLLVFVVIGMALVEPRFYGLPNLFNILRNTSFLAIMACSRDVGHDRRQHGSLGRRHGHTRERCCSEGDGQRHHRSLWVGSWGRHGSRILSSLGSAAAVGLLNGLCSALLRVPSLIVTLQPPRSSLGSRS